MIPLLAAVLVLTGDPGPRRLTWLNVGLAASFLLALDADRAMTIEGQRRGFIEMNPVLGERPTERQVNAYTALVAAGGLTIGALLPSKARNWWFGAWTIVEVMYAHGHTVLGVKLQF